MRLPHPCLVVLVGASGAGKSTWANEQFPAGSVVASDDLRALVGEGRFDQRASADAFAVLDLVLERRVGRKLLTVVDTIGLEPERRRSYVALAARHGLACHAVVFRTPADVCRARNRDRDRPVPPKVLTAQLKALDQAEAALADEGFAGVHAPEPVELVAPALMHAPGHADRQKGDPVPMQFGLQIPSFTWDGGSEAIAERLTSIARAAEDAGFTSIWVMDHFIQIPQAGREWHEMLDSYTALAFLAGQTTTARLGTLVTGVTYRNVAHLAKIVATLDVLSRGRAICGIGAAWFEREHRAYGWTFPAVRDRFALLEDALQALPLMWGPGTTTFKGKVIAIDDAPCYPRPLQEHVPVLVGGSGERRTLRLVARYADACNLFGDPATVRRKVAVLDMHCAAEERPRDAVMVTHLSTVLVGGDRAGIDATVERLRPSAVPAHDYATRVNAGTVSDHVGRFREYTDAGVQTAIVSMPDVADPEAIARFGEVIAAFPHAGPW